MIMQAAVFQISINFDTFYDGVFKCITHCALLNRCFCVV